MTTVPTELLNRLWLCSFAFALLLIAGGLALLFLVAHWSRQAKLPVDDYTQYIAVSEHSPVHAITVNVVIR